ncbi:septal ring lytic transglycosylase RlpA family protein [Bradyrhizobium tunisiense]|uniref:septal ring lytic transglycosylase RlpA family protein n=1 Tax=Bradyrhizobium tunisiense TaxID=3278709 RepID=UPI0035D595A4
MTLEPALLYGPHGGGTDLAVVAFAIVAALVASIAAVAEARRGPSTAAGWLCGVALLAIVLMAVLVGSVTASHARAPEACARRFAGIASYYSNGESGSRTASGARFDDRLPTAAHRCLPFGTRLRVSRGERSVVVTVNDRGPFVAGRVLDLARAPAAALGMLGAGVARVEVEVVD